MLVNVNSRRDIKCRTKFGEWLVHNIYHNDLTITQLAKRLHLSRATVSAHVNGTQRPTFVHILAYCYVFEKISGETEFPQAIYKMVDEEL